MDSKTFLASRSKVAARAMDQVLFRNHRPFPSRYGCRRLVVTSISVFEELCSIFWISAYRSYTSSRNLWYFFSIRHDHYYPMFSPFLICRSMLASLESATPQIRHGTPSIVVALLEPSGFCFVECLTALGPLQYWRLKFIPGGLALIRIIGSEF